MKHRVHLVPRPVIQGKEANWTPFANARQRNTIYNTLWSLICHAALRWKLYTIHCTHNNAIPYNTLWSMICNAASKWKLHTIRHYINDTQRSIKMKTAHHTSTHNSSKHAACPPVCNTWLQGQLNTVTAWQQKGVTLFSSCPTGGLSQNKVNLQSEGNIWEINWTMYVNTQFDAYSTKNIWWDNSQWWFKMPQRTSKLSENDAFFPEKLRSRPTVRPGLYDVR